MKMPTQNEIAEFVKESVEWLKENKEGCSMMDMPNGLCIAVGWSAGFDEDDPTVITDGEWGICCGIKLNNSYMKTDFDTDFVSLYDRDDGEYVIEDYAIKPDEDYIILAKQLISDYDFLEETYEWDEDGAITIIEK